MRKTVCPFPFPYKRGIWLDFQTKENTLNIQSLNDLKHCFTEHFTLYDYGMDDLNFERLIEINLLDLIFEEIGINKFLLMMEKARKNLLYLMFLQVGGFNPYDFHMQRFSQYTTESIAKNLKGAFEYHERVSKTKTLKTQTCESPKDMLKLLLKNFSFDIALQLWTCYKYLRWTMEHKNILLIFNFSDAIHGKDVNDCKSYIKLFKYLYLFYSIVDEHLVMKCVFNELEYQEGLNVLTICLEEANPSLDFLSLKLLLIKFYSVLFKVFDFQAL